MKEFKGTSGEWHTRQTASNSIAVKSSETNLILAEAIIDKEDDEALFETRENIRLMSLSPNLLQCLTKLVEAHESDNTKDYGFWVEQGRHIINKALGI